MWSVAHWSCVRDRGVLDRGSHNRLSHDRLCHNRLSNHRSCLDCLLVHHLSLDWIVLNPFLVPVDRDVLCHFVVKHLRDVLSLVLHCLVLGNILLSWHLDPLDDLLVLNISLLVWNVFDTTLSLNHRLGRNHRGSHNWLHH